MTKLELIRPQESINISSGEVNYRLGYFHDMRNYEHRRLYTDHLIKGNVGANESYGPFGFAIMISLNDEMKEKQRRVELIGEVKQGRDMREKPPTIMVPRTAIDQIVDFQAMARWNDERAARFQEGVTNFLVQTGTFSEVVLQPGFAKLLPIGKTIVIDGVAVNTAILACVDEQYPFLAEIVSNGWEHNCVMAISSANRSGEPTSTNPDDVWKIVKGMDHEVMILDNPQLRQEMGQLDKLNPCSYTILQATTGWRESEGNILFNIMRQGNVSPGRVYEGLKPGFKDVGLWIGRDSDLHASKILAREPYCNLARPFPPTKFCEALGIENRETDYGW